MKTSHLSALVLGSFLVASPASGQSRAREQDPAFIEFYQEQKQRLGPNSREITLRVYAYRDTLQGRKTMHVGDLGGRGESGFRLTVDPGDYQFIVIAEEPTFKAKRPESRSIERLRPNVDLSAYPMKTTRVRIGTVGGGFDSRSGNDITSPELSRYARPQNDRSDNNPITSDTSPSATQFSTVIIVEEPKLTEAEKKR